MIDCVYVAASALDARFTRICVASVRRAYPHLPIRLLVGGRLQPGLARELALHLGVAVADFPIARYGWGFVKLEPLFGPAGETFLMLDSDTALTGPVLDMWRDADAPFIIDNEKYELQDIPSRYYDWRKLRELDPHAQPPCFVFNSGQWVGTSGILTREDFDPWLVWSFPRHLRHPDAFFPGEQGVLNYVLAQKAMQGSLRVAQRPMMWWPGRGMDGLTAKAVRCETARPVIIHWAGIKRLRHSTMPGGDILDYFERLYYRSIPAGGLRRRLAIVLNTCTHVLHGITVRARLRVRKFLPLYPASPPAGSRLPGVRA